MFPTKILLATDGSAEAGRAGRLAVELAGRFDSELHIVYVAPAPGAQTLREPVIYDPKLLSDMRERAEREGRKGLEEEEGRIEKLGGEVAGTHVRTGRADDEIVRLSEELGAGLVVVGSRGLGRLRRALMGSVSTDVVRHAPGSVLVVRGEGNGFPGRILLATDGSGGALAAREAAAEISAATGSELHIVYVLQTQKYRPYPGPEIWEGWETNLGRAKQNACSFLERQAARIEEAGGQVGKTYLALDNPATEIVRLGEELDASLIVVGSRGLGGVRRMLLGSVSSSVVVHAHCPVLVVRAGGEEVP